MPAHNAPPTPPITESDAQQSMARQSAPSPNALTSLGDATPTVYLDIFPTISNLAIQSHLSDLIELAETTELTADPRSRVDPSRLLLIVPLVLSYITVDDLSPAHTALNRLPKNLASHALSRSLLKLVAATQYRNYPLIYKTADELLALTQGDFFNMSLASVIKLLVERYMHAYRRKTAKLLAKAYTSLPIALAVTYFNVSEDDARNSLEVIGWTFDPSTNQFLPPSSQKSSFNRRSGASSLFTVRQMIGGAAQIESSV